MSISWHAPILPSVSLAGIPIGISKYEFINEISKYKVNESDDLYQFDSGPILYLRKSGDYGREVYLFSLHDRSLTNWEEHFESPEHAAVDPRALAVIVQDEAVYAVKVWQFELLRAGDMPTNSYAGKLPQGIGLGDAISDLLPYAELIYNDAEEWYYTDEKFGGLEVTGYGCELENYPEQPIVALAVVGSTGVGH